jgi:hypothetical protein
LSASRRFGTSGRRRRSAKSPLPLGEGSVQGNGHRGLTVANGRIWPIITVAKVGFVAAQIRRLLAADVINDWAGVDRPTAAIRPESKLRNGSPASEVVTRGSAKGQAALSKQLSRSNAIFFSLWE